MKTATAYGIPENFVNVNVQPQARYPDENQRRNFDTHHEQQQPDSSAWLGYGQILVFALLFFHRRDTPFYDRIRASHRP
jgi:hypothetical protein